ncbi:N-acetylmuramoyl-L-alanine amidase [Streptomyces sp. NPDC096205]|uniref:N-acetylmuramoyl-L-alanine amidase n=1 Tax=Streptomyces sp. NPDC096205 TaxID=3366081 RepID=UPI003803AF97
MKTGPQRYPGASTAYWCQGRYPGSPMEVNVVVLHTTEGRSLPSYDGGALAPNLTAVPDFSLRRLDWFQHFDIDVSSRALRNLAGGVETNTLNVCQVELVGTCDPATHAKWEQANYAHIYWPKAPDWALTQLAEFLRWMHAEHGVPLTGPSAWPAYPSSYGNGAGQRLSASSWSAFKGVCGHMHVPENDHGDPGAIDFERLIALAEGAPIPSEEDDMPTAAEIAAEVVKQLPRATWLTDGLIKNVNPGTSEANPTLSPSQALANTEAVARRIDRRTADQTAQLGALSAAVAALAAGGGLDAAEIQAAAEAGATAALDRLGDALTEGV